MYLCQEDGPEPMGCVCILNPRGGGLSASLDCGSTQVVWVPLSGSPAPCIWFLWGKCWRKKVGGKEARQAGLQR